MVEPMKAKFNGLVLILPDWKFRQPDARVPHRSKTLAVYKLPGQRVHFYVCANRRQTLYWVYASGPGFAGEHSRASNTVSTTSARLAALWVEAVNAGNVRIE